MKKVFEKSEIAHLWANKVQTEARTPNSSFYFNHDVIYSYGSHFPIAVHYNGKILFTTRTYSNTTASHLSLVKSACSHKEIVYCKHPLEAYKGNHTENLEAFNIAAKSESSNLPKSTKPAKYLDAIAYQKSLFEAYVQFFNLKVNISDYAYLLIVSKTGAIEASEADKKAKELADKKRAAKQKRAFKKALLLDVKKVDLWKSFEFTALHLYLSNHNNNTYLRFNASTNEIETSKGIKLPLNVAKRFYKWFNAVLLKGGCDGNCNRKILDYEVTSVNKGGLIVGCHNISIDEINLISKHLI